LAWIPGGKDKTLGRITATDANRDYTAMRWEDATCMTSVAPRMPRDGPCPCRCFPTEVRCSPGRLFRTDRPRLR